MNRADAPKKQPIPFGVNGQRESLLPTTPAGDNTASYDAGFPPVTMILKAAGGLPPKGQDMNQILYELSTLSRWASSGALNSYDASFSNSIAGYPKAAVLVGDDGVSIFISTSDGNLTNPNSGGAGWFNLSTGYLKSANNLSEIFTAGSSAQASARTNLGLGNSATLNTGAVAGTVATGNDSRIVGAAQKASNLSDLANAATARTNLGLGTVATESILPITKGGTGATGFDDARTNLGVNRLGQSDTDTVIISPSDNYRLFVADNGVWGVINNIGTPQPLAINTGGTGGSTAAAARANLGLGSAAVATVGNGAGQVPSMENFTSGPGWVKFPDGTIIQFGVSISGPQQYPTAISFPVPFTQEGFKITTSFDSATSSANDCPAFATTAIGLSGFYLMSSRVGSGTGAGANWIAIGR